MTKCRQNLYLERDVSDALEALASKPGVTKSGLVNAAVTSWLARRGTKEVDDLFRHRLDRMTREIGLARRDLEVLLESLSLFVRHQLTVAPAVPEGDRAALAIGRDRFEKFVAQVGRQLAAGTRTLGAPDAGERS